MQISSVPCLSSEILFTVATSRWSFIARSIIAYGKSGVAGVARNKQAGVDAHQVWSLSRHIKHRAISLFMKFSTTIIISSTK